MKVMIPSEEWKKLSDEVKSLLEGFSSDDASTKKIYCHPINFDIRNLSNVVIGRCTMLIFNNNATPFSSFSDLITHIRTWGLNTALIMANGGAIHSTKTLILSVLAVTSDDSSSGFYGFYADGSGYNSSPLALNSTVIDNFSDGVNAIN